MNEKIRKLAEQADAYAHLTGEGMIYQKTRDRYTEKFAELIVEECDTLCQQYAKQRDDKMMGIMSDPTEQIVARKMGTMIKEHFGVEE